MIKKIEWINDDTFYGAVTLKDAHQPEMNNMALHVCQNEKDVLKNRIKLSNELNLPLSNWILPWQKHTANMAHVTKKNHGQGAFDKNTSIMNVDAIYTTEPNTLIGVFTADCVGMLIIDPTTPFIGAIHSGWKGTIQAITTKCLQQWKEDHLIRPSTTHVYFSPSILKESLEVGLEVVEGIKQLPFNTSPFIQYTKNNKAYIDNQGLNMQMLKLENIPESNLHPTPFNTKKEINTCFSYRNDKKTGEHFTFGYIKKPR